uniref:Uncharacterized protein n=1 Tax=Anopheles atroparvus TaxID=41427 RepID=A0AAG5CRY0_ANOAO
MGNKENVPGKGQDYSATAFTSPSDIRPVEQPPQRQRLQPFTQITELIQQRRQQQHHNRQDESMVEQQRGTQKLYASYATQKAVQFDDISENTLSFPTSSVLTRDDQRSQSAMVRPMAADGSPRKVRPRKLVEQPKVSPVQQNLAEGKTRTSSVAKRGQAVLPSGVVPDSSASSASYGASSKVQYYDYNTRYTKEYDQPVAFVQREERRTTDPNAMEEANRYEKLQQDLAAARSKSAVDRTKPALEKQQTRKDYEKLSKELDNLTRSENKLKSLAVPSKNIPTEVTIKAKAEARQRKANEAIENLLQQRALVTCPVVHQETSTHPRRSRSGTRAPRVVNVAEARSDAAAASKNVSSDSCTSIVLGTFERPGIPLPPTGEPGKRDEDALDGGVDKIGRLKELLDQINEQRRLLTEELAKERSAEPTVGGVEELCAAMQKNTELDKLESMKRRQEELLEQQKLLQTREREVEELERQLRDKMAQLRKNKQQREGESAPKANTANKRQGHPPASLKTPATTVHVETRRQRDAIEVEVAQPSTATSTSDSIEEGDRDHDSSDRARDVPVKIIITVNDKSTPSKKKRKKKLDRKRSPKVVPFEPPKVTVTAQREEKPVEKEQPKPMEPKEDVARPKKGPLGRVVGMDFSPGSTSTTSTVYRELPPKIGRLKINSMLPDPPVANIEPSPPPLAPKYQLQRKPPIAKSSSKVAKETASQPAISSAHEANLNPQLVKYIVRLLGMSRQSIDQLGVSSTTVSTPNASVVNVSSNVGGATIDGPANDETDRMNRLRKFIDENYNFLQEIDETLKRSDQSTLGSGDSSRVDSVRDPNDDVSRVEDVWMRTLRSREKGMRKKQAQRNPPQDHPAMGAKTKTKKKRTEDTDVVAAALPPQPVVVPQPAERPAPGAVSQVSNTPGDVGSSFGAGTSGSNRVVTKEASLKSILKSPKRNVSPKVAKIITPQGHVEIINLSDREEQAILGRYSQLTERCSQRITELSQMIAQVREEKRRLIEDSLSSLDQQESTKYMDLPAHVTIHPAGGRELQLLPQPPPPPMEANERPGSVVPVATPSPGAGGVPVILDDPASEEIDNIFSSKQIGLSKDSGIAMSRPLTASDIRESPSEEGSQGKEPLPFEPFLKDIHKPVPSVGGRLFLPPPAGGPGPSVPVVGVVGTRKPPPVAITRYSPQLDEVPVHELSTILEVDTPAVAAGGSASKVYDVSSLSAAGERSETAKEMVLIEARNRLLLEPPSSPSIAYEQFPDYEEYVRPDGATGSPVPIVNLEATEAMAGNETSAVRLDLTEERDPGRLQYRSFPGAAPSFDLTEDEPGSRNAERSQSDASLPDVVAELQKINIILKPYDHSLDNSNRSTPLSREATRGEDGAASSRQKRSMIVDKPAHDQRKPAPPPDLEGLSDSLGRDLESVAGLGWASAMLKKNQEKKRQQPGQHTQLQENSSSSSSPLTFDASKGKITGGHGVGNDVGEDDSRDGGSGKPPNLAKFIARELMVRTQSDLQSISFSSSELSSSPGSHSALLRSLLSISNLEHTSHDDAGGSSAGGGGPLTTTMNNVQRTSTPVASKSTTASGGGSSSRLAGPPDATDSGAANNRTLFSGESRISSVHWSSSSGSSDAPSHGLSAPDMRLERRSSVVQREEN